MSNYYCPHCLQMAWKEPCNHCGEDAFDLPDVVGVLRELHAFGKLDKGAVFRASVAFGVDAEEICKANGITYRLPSGNNEDEIR